MDTALILASSSPRRRELLGAAGYVFDVFSPEIDETPWPGEAAEAHVLRMAREKAAAIAGSWPNHLVLAADTIVVLEGSILGKPASAQQAEGMLCSLSGRGHQVMTAVSIQLGSCQKEVLCVSDVTFRELSQEDIRRYVASGEPMDKAGAYGIQGSAAGFVREIRGSYTNIVGLPLAEVIEALGEMDQAP